MATSAAARTLQDPAARMARPATPSLSLRRKKPSLLAPVLAGVFGVAGLGAIVAGALAAAPGAIALGAFALMLAAVLLVVRLIIGETAVDLTPTELVVTRGRKVERFPRTALAGLEVHYRSNAALAGAVAGGVLGAALLHDGGKKGGQPMVLRVWLHGARKPRPFQLAMHRKDDFARWIAQVEGAGVRVRHGDA